MLKSVSCLTIFPVTNKKLITKVQNKNYRKTAGYVLNNNVFVNLILNEKKKYIQLQITAES